MGRKRILIVDDEINFCKLVKMNLEFEGDFEVFISLNGKGGLASAKKLKPDLILLDIRMPGMTGFEVLEKLKSDTDTLGIPVVMLTAVVDEASKEKAVKLYDEDYITKPIDAAALKAKIKEILERRKIK